jgi:hypothetical protein
MTQPSHAPTSSETPDHGASPSSTRAAHLFEPQGQRGRAPRAAPAAPVDAPWYRREPWLPVGLVAFLPVSVAALVPQPWRTSLAALTGVLMSIAFVMLIRRDRAVRAEELRERKASTGA